MYPPLENLEIEITIDFYNYFEADLPMYNT